MYSHHHWALGLSAFAGLGFHLGGTGVVWSVVFGATALGMSLSAGRIAVELGVPHAGHLLGLLRGRPHLAARLAPCTHCGTVHA
jgi:hypothetical protein